MSVRASMRSPLTCSGAMYGSVPTRCGSSTLCARVSAFNPPRDGSNSLAKPKVQHLHLSLGRNGDVCGFQIPVNDPVLVRLFQRLGNLNPESSNFFLAERR